MYPLRYILVFGMMLVLWAGSPFSLRGQVTQEPTVRTAGSVANVFETLDPNQSLEGLRLTIPDSWRLEEVRLLRYGTEPVPIQKQRTEEPGSHLFTVGTPLTGPHDLLLRVQLPDRTGTYDWSLQALVRNASSSDSVQRSRFRTVDRRRHQLTVQSSPGPDHTNKALSLAEAKAPLRIPADLLPSFDRTSSFTIEFWMRTNGLDETVLSTWNGDESVPYPAEFVVDRGGRLRYYVGQPGKHRALRAGRPVADGEWHHVAAVYDAERARLQLLFDGRRVDSLQDPLVSTAPGPIPMALGGRLGQEQEADRSPLFSGELDELRVWGDARSQNTIQRMKSRPLRDDAEGEGGDQFVRLGFDGQESALVQQWPDGARRVPSTLSFRPRLRNLQAQTDGRTITLEWTAASSDVKTFVVERSSQGQTFTPITELNPGDARQASVSDSPRFSYTDADVTGHVVFYRIRLKMENGMERTSGTIKIGLGPDSEGRSPVKLIGNFPNPFSETTTVAYEVNKPRPVTITVWDVAGHRIAQLVAGMRGAGYHETSFDATDLPSGTYFVKLKTPAEKQMHRMVVLK